MRLTLEDVAVIERIVRQSSYIGNIPDEAKFGEWIGVDQDQALALIEMIPTACRAAPCRVGGRNCIRVPASDAL